MFVNFDAMYTQTGHQKKCVKTGRVLKLIALIVGSDFNPSQPEVS